MPPNNEALLGPVDCEVESSCPPATLPDGDSKATDTSVPYKPTIIWTNVFFITLIHILALYTFFFKLLLLKYSLYSFLYGVVLTVVPGIGVTAGAHRLWTHRAYKAKRPLQVILLLCYSMAGQNSLHEWVRDHRVHHKFSETDADPHNSNRGFFFAHVGWLMQKKHPEVLRRGAKVDMSDILQDPLVSFHTRYFTMLKLVFCFILPTLGPIYLGVNVVDAVLGVCVLRYVIGLNIAWMVNSAAHMYGNKPFDKRIGPTENLTVAILAMGEGWHNYHHVFPWDYKTAELGNYRFNVTTAVIDMFAKIGWAYDLKSASPSLVSAVVRKHGDGTYEELSHDHHH